MPEINTDFFQNNYEPLVLIVNPVIHTLEEEKKSLLTRFNWPIISIGKDLSRDMVSGQVIGTTAIQTWLMDQLGVFNSSPILISDIDLLFEPRFKLDPLILFQRASRLSRMIVFWPGTFNNENVLSYAVPEHQHYRTWRNPEAKILTL